MSDIGQEDFSISLDGGKYRVVSLVGGGFRWLRYDEPWPAANDLTHSKVVVSMIFRIHELEVQVAAKPPGPATEPEIQGEDGTTRKAHYGAGRQPWDDMLDLGWGPHFAAGSALKYVRRYMNKNGEDDLKKGRWYYHEILTRATSEINGPWTKALTELEDELSVDERRLLRANG